MNVKDMKTTSPAQLKRLKRQKFRMPRFKQRSDLSSNLLQVYNECEI